MSARPVELVLQCEECERLWLHDDGDRWRAYLSSDDEIVMYCPDCAEREFGDD